MNEKPCDIQEPTRQTIYGILYSYRGFIPLFFCICLSVIAYLGLNLTFYQAFIILGLMVGLLAVIDGIREGLDFEILMGAILASAALGSIIGEGVVSMIIQCLDI